MRRGEEICRRARSTSRDREAHAMRSYGQRRDIWFRRACTRGTCGPCAARPDGRLAPGRSRVLLISRDWAENGRVGQSGQPNCSGIEDPYRRARADCTPRRGVDRDRIGRPRLGRAVPGYGVCVRAEAPRSRRPRTELQRLSRFHMQRGERYDAGLQLHETFALDLSL